MRFKKVTSLVITALMVSALGVPCFADNALTGTLTSLSWVNNQQVVVAHEQELGLEFFLVDTKDAISKLLIPENKNATEVAVSKDGSQVAYVNNNGEIYTVSLKDFSEIKISSDKDPKTELQWSADDSKLYFLKGEKFETIGVITLKTKKTSIVLADKVPYKSDLRVSQDGKKVVYTVTNAGTTDATTLSISSKGTEPQIFSLNTRDSKPVKLTSTLDNKTYSLLTPTGAVMYLSTTPTADEKSVLRLTSANGKGSIVNVGNLTVQQTLLTPDGNSWLLATDGNNKQSVYNILPSGEKRERFEVPSTVTEIVLSPDANHALAIVQGTENSSLQLISKNGSTTLN